MKKLSISIIALIMLFSCTTTIFATEANSKSLTNTAGTAQPLGETGSYWTFKKSSQSQYTATNRAKKISACYAPGFTATVSSSRNFSASFSAGCPSGVKPSIFSACSISIGASINSATSYSAKNKDKKKDAHIIFTPYYIKISGTAYKRSTLGGVISQKSVTGYYPKKDGKFADGRFSLEYHTKNKCNR